MSEKKSLLDYFIERTDERLDSIDEKLDSLIKFKWHILGVLSFLTIIVTAGLQAIFKVGL